MKNLSLDFWPITNYNYVVSCKLQFTSEKDSAPKDASLAAETSLFSCEKSRTNL